MIRFLLLRATKRIIYLFSSWKLESCLWQKLLISLSLINLENSQNRQCLIFLKNWDQLSVAEVEGEEQIEAIDTLVTKKNLYTKFEMFLKKLFVKYLYRSSTVKSFVKYVTCPYKTSAGFSIIFTKLKQVIDEP